MEALEERALLSAAGGTVSGVAFIDANSNGVHDGGETTLPGITVTLTGSTNSGVAVNTTATTDANGAYAFTNVIPGSYFLSSGSGGAFQGGGKAFPSFSIAAGATVTQDLAFGGIAPAGISLRLFLSTTTSTIPFAPPGNGQASVDQAPTVSTPITNQSVTLGTPSTTLDLAGNFTDPDITNTQIRFDVTAGSFTGSINAELFDKQAPRTVANFLNYVESARYDNSIFHRLAQNFVLQGGGFTFDPNGPSLPAIKTDPAVQNEFGTSNTIGTIAMAKLGNDPNSATDQFFFNLADNSSNLDSQNGGFTVFGKILGPSDQNVLNTLAAQPTQKQASPFDQIPLINYSGTNFPTDTTAANYELLKDVAIVSRGDSLTYSVVSNSNPSLVTATLGTAASGGNNRLTLQYAAGQTGTATITVRATDQFGLSVDQTFTVTVS